MTNIFENGLKRPATDHEIALINFRRQRDDAALVIDLIARIKSESARRILGITGGASGTNREFKILRERVDLITTQLEAVMRAGGHVPENFGLDDNERLRKAELAQMAAEIAQIATASNTLEAGLAGKSLAMLRAFDATDEQHWETVTC